MFDALLGFIVAWWSYTGPTHPIMNLQRHTVLKWMLLVLSLFFKQFLKIYVLDYKSQCIGTFPPICWNVSEVLHGSTSNTDDKSEGDDSIYRPRASSDLAVCQFPQVSKQRRHHLPSCTLRALLHIDPP